MPGSGRSWNGSSLRLGGLLDDRYEAAVRAGEALSREDAIELALTPVSPSATADEQAISVTAFEGVGTATYFVSRGSVEIPHGH